jgi:hypothetical protein
MTEASAERVSDTTATELVERTTVELQHDRGILYVYGSDGKPLLKITGLPRPAPRLTEATNSNRQLTIEIRGESAVCNWGPTPAVVTAANPRPHPIEDDPWREERGDSAYILRTAGATMPPGADK